MLVGFSGGAAFAGGLLLDDPTRYAGAAILSAHSRSTPASPPTPDRLDELPVLVVHGDARHVIPRDLLDRTWSYLTTDAGSTTTAVRDPGGHGLSADALTEMQQWLITTLAEASSGA